MWYSFLEESRDVQPLELATCPNTSKYNTKEKQQTAMMWYDSYTS